MAQAANMERMVKEEKALHSPLSISHNVLKFRLSSDMVGPVRETVRANLPMYEFEKGFSPTLISTVYFDTEDLTFGRGVIANPLSNVRVRAREYYYNSPDGTVSSPYVWVEIKFRSGSLVTKKRFRLPKARLAGLYGGEDITDTLIRSNPRAGSWAISHYHELRGVFAMQSFQPAVVTHYTREVFQDRLARLRLTFDRDISYHNPPDDIYNSCRVLSRENLGPALGREEACILELKDHNSVPAWLRPLVNEKKSTAYSKFSAALSLLLGEKSGK